MTEVIYVHRVSSRRTSAGEKFDIAAKLQPGAKWGPVYETFNAWEASLAEQAQAQGFPVRVTWRQSTYGRELTAIQRADRPQAVA